MMTDREHPEPHKWHRIPDGETYQSAAEILSEETGRPIEEFQVPDGVEVPDLEELDSIPAEEFYDDD